MPHRSEPNRNHFVNVPPVLPTAWNTVTNVLTNNGLIFPSDPRRITTTTTTTPKPIRTTTANSFWQDWSLPVQVQPTQPMLPVARPTNTQNQNSNVFPIETNGFNGNTVQITTPQMTKVISATTTTVPNMLPWMQDVLNEYSTTLKPNNHQIIQTTTLKPVQSTAENPFWNEWSATNPTAIVDNNIDNNFPNGSHSNQGFSEKLRQTTTEMPGWMNEVLNKHSTTSSVNNENNNAIKITTARAETTTNMPSWMRDILNEHSTTTIRSTFVTSTTKKSTFGDGNPFFGGGGGGGNVVSTPNRYSM